MNVYTRQSLCVTLQILSNQLLIVHFSLVINKPSVWSNVSEISLELVPRPGSTVWPATQSSSSHMCISSDLFSFCLRFMTVLYYLNDVKRGGETAFPVADEKNINQTVWEAFKAIEVKGEFTHLSSASEFPSSLPANDTLKNDYMNSGTRNNFERKNNYNWKKDHFRYGND